MTANTVIVDTSNSPAKLAFADRFNVAVPFIDRHLDEGRGDKIAIRDDDGDTTYAQLATAVNRAGNALMDLGLAPGDRVILAIKDCPAFFFAFWGAIKAGFVPVPVNTLLRAKDLQFIIEDSGAACSIWSPEYAAEMGPALAGADPAHHFPTEGEDGSFAARMASAEPDLEAAPATAEDDCFWLYTSGSTGTPKGAVHAHRDMVVTSQYYGVETLGITADDIHFSAAKLFFAYGLGNAMTLPLWTGGQSVLFAGRPTPDIMADHIERYRPTHYYAVPTLFAAQLHALESKGADFSSLRVCVSAGEPLPASLFARWREHTGLTILDGIGTTEILHIFIGNRPDDAKPGTSGKLVPGYEARIVDDNDQAVATGEIGNLLIRGGSVTSRYWNQPERTAAAITDGWIRTGDSYFQDDDGYFTCCGRSDDMLKVGGIWVSPVEIEARLVSHDAVLEAAVIGRPDDEELIKPEAFIILKNSDDASDELAEALKTFCQEELARYKYPRWVHFVDELPKTATGKIQRFKLRG
ncbi:MAG: benzoate-CoA ligase family protein [Rhodospirillaceae bacterium]|jgi:benzoate-CoA ligase family protein|nr:benzoate-CoA ligase family protein [Rhodospirillaceae bacterium]MBT4772194.1 benzoate-CoA ligase family protein [Rhodospirillaceae bacterium]MBT5359481.1 benzoate-CoA ligase family protein [Rhodospirillaceae bacterium]MBT5768326.1 benzoate-CoA ligase family protein [Rhodospirillaceae bacterium]MBT6309643.1 benzoate-CoA ligase family protein [Rhodospirillaceae bacterium]